MKRFLIMLLIMVFALLSCTGGRHYAKKSGPPREKTVVLPESKTGKPPESYVVYGIRYYPLPSSDGFEQTGYASWYGKKFHGRSTSNGERYDMFKMTAAHKTLPFGTHVVVTNQQNKKRTVVRINDRGPFVKGRIIDLSYSAAQEIDLVGPGVAKVHLVALGRQVGTVKSGKNTSNPIVAIDDLDQGEFTIQVGAFLEKANANKIANRLGIIFEYVKVERYVDGESRTLHRVHVSKSMTLAQAEEIEKQLEEMGFVNAFIVRM
jgi:rare lipoprotein A